MASFFFCINWMNKLCLTKVYINKRSYSVAEKYVECRSKYLLKQKRGRKFFKFLLINYIMYGVLLGVFEISMKIRI